MKISWSTVFERSCVILVVKQCHSHNIQFCGTVLNVHVHPLDTTNCSWSCLTMHRAYLFRVTVVLIVFLFAVWWCSHSKWFTGHFNKSMERRQWPVYPHSDRLVNQLVWWHSEVTVILSSAGHQSLTSGMELKKNILVSGNADSTVKVCNSNYHSLHVGSHFSGLIIES